MYAILRTKRIKTLGAVCAHNLRTKYAKNVDPTKTHLNEIFLDKLDFLTRSKNGAADGTYDERLTDYYSEKKAKVKKNSVQAMEFVLTASPEFFTTASPEAFRSWKKKQINFLEKEFGDSLQFVILHMDETSPHFHAIISVEETKIQKFKNRYGSGEKQVTSLNADRYDPIYLQKLQDRYALANKKYGLRRGLRNSKASHQELKEFSKMVKEFTDKSDYSKAIDTIIENIPTFLGACKVSDIQKHFKPVLNALMKRSKAAKIFHKFLPEKIELVNKLIVENEELNKKLEEKRDYYVEAINAKIADNKKIAELEMEIKRLEQYEPKILNEPIKPTFNTSEKVKGVKYGG